MLPFLALLCVFKVVVCNIFFPFPIPQAIIDEMCCVWI